ncbi:hypothetical protein CEP53_001568 [Fusarium sp. AF-6]|nr:hypothetical protein CEP53_001568 [Fusarium sp. AF-6]
MGKPLEDPTDTKSASVPATDMGVGSTVMFPPGTVRLEDGRASAHDGIILQPRPTDDPNDPLNWPSWRKYLNFAIVGFYVLLVSEFINSATPTWGPMRRELGFSDQVLTASYAIGCAFLAIGAIILVPFALKFGRRPLYIISSLVQCGVSIWSAKLQNVADLLLVNVLCTGFGALAEVIVQMTIADMLFVHQRGTFNSIYIWLWQVAVSLGPFIAGFITVGQGWRWVWWWNAVFFGVFFLVACFCYEDTKYCPESSASTTQTGSTGAPRHETESIPSNPVAEERENTRPVSEEGLPHDLYAVRINHDIPLKTYWQRLAITTTSSSGGGIKSFLGHMYQPLVLLGTVPAIAYTALAYVILIALQDVMSTSFSLYTTRPPYDFALNQIGLMNLSKLVGSTIGSLIVGPLIVGPNGLPWPVIAVGLAFYKLGIAPVNSITITYLTDSYKDIIGDALVGVTVVRNTFSTIFIFAVDPWVHAVGIKWVIITIVLITTGILSLTAIFIKYGKTFRARTAQRYQRYALLQYKER